MSTAVLTDPDTSRVEDGWIELDQVAPAENAPERLRADSRGSFGQLQALLDEAVASDRLEWAEAEALLARVLRAGHVQERDDAPPRPDLDSIINEVEFFAATLSSLRRVEEHPGYQHLKQHADDAILLVLERLRSRPSAIWLRFLHDVFGAAPAAGHDTVKGAADAWVEWGRRNGYLG